MQGAGQDGVAQRHDHLDDARDTRRRLGVPEVGLDGAEPQRPLRRALLSVGGEDRLGLDGVAEGGAGAVGLDGVHVGRRDPGAREGLGDDAFLGGAVGAVRPLLAPSWLTAEPRTTASTRWPLRRASESRSTRRTPAPSPHTVPSAAAANGLQRASAASAPCRANSVKAFGEHITVTPPASARSQSPARSACAARCRATSDDEQAVSTVTAGPSNPKVYAMRPVATLPEPPVPRYPAMSSVMVPSRVV
ncbi:hypothetical protein SMD44_07518 [Streptomyces alboflavus]|uniref:Uncharacterized protein n=1 Tax=Streptomyces alboflavus TaxID=67267 RepID=A0A1Z1WP09_9ACTN|nr:hypothetical protein SMD44_07518 [Streptomyces alboflavus]